VNNVFACLIWIFFLCWAVPASHGWQTENLDDDPIRQRLLGTWGIDFGKTAELLSNRDVFGESPDPYAISMLAPGMLKFSAEGILVGEHAATLQAHFQGRESDDQISIDFSDGQRRFTVQLTNVQEDSLQLLAPTTVFGPLVFAYRRVHPQVNPSPADSLVKLAGTWSLNWELSQALWVSLEPAETVQEYLAAMRPQFANMTKLRIEGSVFSFEPEQTAEPFRIELQNESTLQLRSSLDGQYRAEVNVLNENWIQLADERRRLIAIYQRHVDGPDPAPKPTEFPPSQLTGFIHYYGVDSRPRLPDQGPPIGIDGQVEIERLEVHRVRAADAVKHADLTNLRVELFLDLKEKFQSTDSGHLIRLVHLVDIRDDSGKLLLTEKRRNAIDMLQRPVKPQSFQVKRGGRQGPVVGFVIEEPAIGASRIVELAGAFEVAPYANRWIVFRDLRRQIGKDLTHPLLPGVTFRPAIFDGQYPYLELNSNLEEDDRIDHWMTRVLTEEGFEITPTSYGGGNLRQGFAEPLPEKFDLWLEVLDVGPSQRIEFRFGDICLP